MEKRWREESETHQHPPPTKNWCQEINTALCVWFLSAGQYAIVHMWKTMNRTMYGQYILLMSNGCENISCMCVVCGWWEELLYSNLLPNKNDIYLYRVHVRSFALSNSYIFIAIAFYAETFCDFSTTKKKVMIKPIAIFHVTYYGVEQVYEWQKIK